MLCPQVFLFQGIHLRQTGIVHNICDMHTFVRTNRQLNIYRTPGCVLLRNNWHRIFDQGVRNLTFLPLLSVAVLFN